MVRRVHIKGYKSLRDVEVELEPLTVLVGPNDSGKSNFLDALQLLSRMTTLQTLRVAFDPPHRGNPIESFTFGPQGIRSVLQKDVVRLSIEVDVELSDEVIKTVNQQIRALRQRDNKAMVKEKYLRYRIEIENRPQKGSLRVSDEHLSAIRSDGQPKKRRPFIEWEHDHVKLRFEGRGHPTYFNHFLDHAVLSRSFYPLHHPHVVAMQQELSRWFFYYFEPRERMRAPNPVKEVRHIGFMGEELSAFLNTLKSERPRQFNALEKALRLIVPSITGIDVKVDNLGQVELQLREGDMLIPARLVSEGTLRVLGLLTLGGIHEMPALLGFEEPENGVHPRRIELIADYLRTQEAIGKTQIIATTHSTVLVDLIPLKSLYVCSKVRGETKVRPLESSFHKLDIEKMLREDLDSSVSELMLRGDFDA